MKALTDAITALQRLEQVMNDEKRVVTCSEAAYILDVAPSTISKWIRTGKLHKCVGNGVYGVRLKDVYMIYGGKR